MRSLSILHMLQIPCEILNRTTLSSRKPTNLFIQITFTRDVVSYLSISAQEHTWPQSATRDRCEDARQSNLYRRGSIRAMGLRNAICDRRRGGFRAWKSAIMEGDSGRDNSSIASCGGCETAKVDIRACGRGILSLVVRQ